MVRRGYRRSRYVLAFALTMLIFLLGVLLGLVIEGRRLGYIQKQSEIQAIEYASLQLQYQFISELGLEANCPALLEAFDSAVQNVEKARIRLEKYSLDSTLNKADFELLLRDYTLSQVRFWLLARRSKKLCNAELVTLLYFFSTKEECPLCDDQAFILTYLKKRFGDNLLNFAFNAKTKEEPMVAMLLKTYNVTSFPTVVVGDRVFSGLTATEKLVAEICRNLPKTHRECSNSV